MQTSATMGRQRAPGVVAVLPGGTPPVTLVLDWGRTAGPQGALERPLPVDREADSELGRELPEGSEDMGRLLRLQGA